MGVLAGLENNDVVQFLALETNTEYVKEFITFSFCVSILAGVKKSLDLVPTIGLGFLRSFGDLSIVLALGMGTMPGLVFQNLDWYMNILVAAIAWSWFSDNYIPSNISNNFEHVYNVCYSITKANNAGMGYALVSAALPGSFFAPFFGAYLAVNGARILENGIGQIRKAIDNEDILAVGSGVIIYLVTSEQLGGAATLARALVVVFSFSQNYVDWLSYWNQFTAQVKGAINGGAKGAAKRNATPKRK